MMKPLRKRHLQVWTAWAVLLPAGIVFAWLAIPNTTPVKLLHEPAVELLPVIKKTRDKHDYTIHLRTDPESKNWQLEWKNKTALVYPSAVVYQMPRKGTFASFRPGDAALIGRIEARGDYVFPLHRDSAAREELNLVLYDFIHEKTIDSINFEP